MDVIAKVISPESGKKVDYIDIVIEAVDCAIKDGDGENGGKLYITDIMLQGGSISTSWVGHVSEIRWSFDNA